MDLGVHATPVVRRKPQKKKEMIGHGAWKRKVSQGKGNERRLKQMCIKMQALFLLSLFNKKLNNYQTVRKG